ncbi:unnamed protein product, partial [Discosporangium mesarthrocarpum]
MLRIVARKDDLKIHDRRVLRTNIMDRAESAISTLKNDLLKGRTVAATSDIWTANTGVPYISLTAQWIEPTAKQWTLRQATAGCEQFDGSHTSVRIKEKLDKMANAVGMKGHTISLTTDAASNIKKAISDWPGVDWIGCAAHVMERSVQKYVSQKKLKATIDTFNKAVTHIHCLTASEEHLKRAQKNNNKPLKKIPLSCKTRWWSYYNVLTTLLEYRYEV